MDLEKMPVDLLQSMLKILLNSGDESKVTNEMQFLAKQLLEEREKNEFLAEKLRQSQDTEISLRAVLHSIRVVLKGDRAELDALKAEKQEKDKEIADLMDLGQKVEDLQVTVKAHQDEKAILQAKCAELEGHLAHGVKPIEISHYVQGIYDWQHKVYFRDNPSMQWGWIMPLSTKHWGSSYGIDIDGRKYIPVKRLIGENLMLYKDTFGNIFIADNEGNLLLAEEEK